MGDDGLKLREQLIKALRTLVKVSQKRTNMGKVCRPLSIEAMGNTPLAGTVFESSHKRLFHSLVPFVGTRRIG